MTYALAAIFATSLLAGVRPLFQSVRALAASRDQAATDPLTGLGNRRRLLEDLEDELLVASAAEPRVLVLLDLDGFKRYNDTYGHPAGDVLLARLGGQLGEAVRCWGRAYRLGGDEFCVLVGDRHPGLERVVSAAATALSDHGEGFAVRPSSGIVALPLEADTPEGALQVADRRLYVQKSTRYERTRNDEAREVLLQTLREREPSLGAHLSDVAELARVVGRELGLGTDELDVVVRAAELHDVGKIAVPDTILAKPGPLDEDEWGYIRQHTIVGDRILRAASAMAPVADLVRASQERWDGSGYPDGLLGKEIPLGARIVAVCDAFDAMVSGRPYRRAVSRRVAVDELCRKAGTQFDPAVVEAFCRVAAPAPAPNSRPGTRPAPKGLGLLATVALAVLMLAAPAGALGANASVSGGQLTVTAGSAEANNLTVSLDGADIPATPMGAPGTTFRWEPGSWRSATPSTR